jgi:hypothetical protein
MSRICIPDSTRVANVCPSVAETKHRHGARQTKQDTDHMRSFLMHRQGLAGKVQCSAANSLHSFREINYLLLTQYIYLFIYLFICLFIYKMMVP